MKTGESLQVASHSIKVFNRSDRLNPKRPGTRTMFISTTPTLRKALPTMTRYSMNEPMPALSCATTVTTCAARLYRWRSSLSGRAVRAATLRRATWSRSHRSSDTLVEELKARSLPPGQNSLINWEKSAGCAFGLVSTNPLDPSSFGATKLDPLDGPALSKADVHYWERSPFYGTWRADELGEIHLDKNPPSTDLRTRNEASLCPSPALLRGACAEMQRLHAGSVSSDPRTSAIRCTLTRIVSEAILCRTSPFTQVVRWGRRETPPGPPSVSAARYP